MEAVVDGSPSTATTTKSPLVSSSSSASECGSPAASPSASSSSSSSSSSSGSTTPDDSSFSDDENSPAAIARRCGPPTTDVLPPAGPVAARHPLPMEAFTDSRLRQLDLLQPYGERALIREWSVENSRWLERFTSVVVCLTPFARGCMRSAYYFVDLESIGVLRVAKRYRRTSVPDQQYYADVSMQTVAEHWATMFNRYNPPKKVRFVPACVVELLGRASKVVLAAELHLEGDFHKHNSNNGFVVSSTSELFRCTPQAFSHFTYHFSSGALMICDMQGVGDQYTDPQVHTIDGSGFGRGNLGRKGMEKFLKSHTCNAVCQRFGMPLLTSEKDRAERERKRLRNADAASASPPLLLRDVTPKANPLQDSPHNRAEGPGAAPAAASPAVRSLWPRLKDLFGIGKGGNNNKDERAKADTCVHIAPVAMGTLRLERPRATTPDESDASPPPLLVQLQTAVKVDSNGGGSAPPPVVTSNPCTLLGAFKVQTSGGGSSRTPPLAASPGKIGVSDDLEYLLMRRRVEAGDGGGCASGCGDRVPSSVVPLQVAPTFEDL